MIVVFCLILRVRIDTPTLVCSACVIAGSDRFWWQVLFMPAAFPHYMLGYGRQAANDALKLIVLWWANSPAERSVVPDVNSIFW